MKKETIKKILEVLSLEKKCNRLGASAIIMKDKTIISLGYNGAVRGAEECYENGCLIVNNHCERTCHAEENAIINAARIGVSTMNAEMYTLYFPCKDCIKAIVNSGIRVIYYFNDYTDEINKQLAGEYVDKHLVKIIKLEVE